MRDRGISCKDSTIVTVVLALLFGIPLVAAWFWRNI